MRAEECLGDGVMGSMINVLGNDSMHTMCLASFPRGQLCARFGHDTGHIKTRPIRTRSANPKIEKCSHTRQGHLHWIAQAFPLDFLLGFRRSFKLLLKVLLACFVHSDIDDVSEIKAYTLLRSSTETLVGNQVVTPILALHRFYTGQDRRNTSSSGRVAAWLDPGFRPVSVCRYSTMASPSCELAKSKSLIT